MFLPFFYQLRSAKVPVSTSEYLDLLRVLQARLSRVGEFGAREFYQLARNCLVKDVKHYDAYDQVFSACFSGQVNSNGEFREKLNSWLEKAHQQHLSEERLKNAQSILESDLLKELQKRIDEQKDAHHGGNYWIGTGGTSAFGHSGYNQAGIRIGGQGRNRSALAVAGERKFKDYNQDEVLNVRQIKSALKALRIFKHSGAPELHLDETIQKSVRMGGEIEPVFKRSRKNDLRLLLIMDVGGSMTPYARELSRLFSAAHQVQHFKEFKALYFHNIFYDRLYFSASMNGSDSYTFDELKRHFPKSTRVIFVGDAYMAPYELHYLTAPKLDFYRTLSGTMPDDKGQTAFASLQEFKRYFSSSVWLNPEPKRLWNEPTIRDIRSVVSMFPLSLNGLNESIKSLL